MNTVIISGRLGADAEMKSANGKAVCSFRLALDSFKRDAPAEWITVIAWEKTAEFVCNHLGKGRKVLVEGRLQVREWADRETGAKRSVVEVVASRVEFMDSSPEKAGAAAPTNRPPPGQEHQAPGYFDNDVPF